MIKTSGVDISHTLWGRHRDRDRKGGGARYSGEGGRAGVAGRSDHESTAWRAAIGGSKEV